MYSFSNPMLAPKYLIAFLVCFVGAGATQADEPDGSIFVVTSILPDSGELLKVSRSAPWSVQFVSRVFSFDATVQAFDDKIFLVDPSIDEIRVFEENGVLSHSFNVGTGTSPRDILLTAPDTAYVTRANSTHLYRVNPQTGIGEDVIDLADFADEDGLPEMERMVAVGSRLFVQLRRSTQGLGPKQNNGALAVVDLDSEQLIDVDPSTEQIDAIELIGPAPRLRMYVDPVESFLLVSATDGFHLSLGGGIERVNLRTLRSEGFVIDEFNFAALGGFIMTNSKEGYYLFHTDIVPSNHLQQFSLESGPVVGPEVLFDLGMYLDALLYDPDAGFIFMPSSLGGLYVVDVKSNQQATGSPIEFPNHVIDQVLVPVLLGDVNKDGSVNLQDVGVFVQRLISGTFQDEADIDRDGEMTALDIDPFVDILVSL